jgi:transposase
MNISMKRTQRDYSLSFKLSVVGQVEKGELTCQQAQARYGIQGRSTVLVWLRKHGRAGLSGSQPLMRGVMMDDPKGKTALSPEQRIKELEVQLKQANQKAQLFEAIVEVLKKDYGVRVVKKPSGGSSRKGSSKA